MSKAPGHAIARAAGLLAHRVGTPRAVQILRNIANALERQWKESLS